MTTNAKPGESIPFRFLAIDKAGNKLTGYSSLVVSIFRASDGYRYDFNTSAFVSTGGTQTAALSQINASDAATTGWYEGVSFTVPNAFERYYATISDTGTSVGNTPATDDIVVAPPSDAMAYGTASAGATNSITLTGASSTDNAYKMMTVAIVGGTGVGQARMVASYNGTTKVATVSRSWAITPDSTSLFAVLPVPQPTLLDAGIAQGGTLATITLASTSIATNAIYVGCTVVITDGAGAGQARVISSYVGSTKVATLCNAWSIAPDSTSVYTLMPTGRALVEATVANAISPTSFVSGTLGTVWDEATSSHNTGGTFGALARDTYIALSDFKDTLIGPSFIVQAGSTSTSIVTGLSYADGTFDDAEVILSDGSIVVTRRVVSYTSNTMTLDKALPYTPSPGDTGAVYNHRAPLIPATIEDTVWDAAQADHTTANTFGYALGNIAPNAIASAVWDEAYAGHGTAGTYGLLVATNLDVTVGSRSTLTAAQVWATAVPGAFNAGEAGYVLGTNLNAMISSRLADADYTAPLDATATSNAVWDEPLGNHTTVDTYGWALDARVSQVPYETWQEPSADHSGTQTMAYVLLTRATTGDAMTLASDAITSAVLAASAISAIQSGLATTTSLASTQTALAAAISGVPAAVVSQPIAGASAGSVGAALATASGYVIPAAVAIAAAVWDMDLATYGTYAQITKAGGTMYAMKIATYNRAVETAGNPGTLVIYQDDSTTAFATMQLRDASSGAVTSAAGEPAQRTKAT